ncbi:DUF3054 domain-containing protein [Cephalotus follicularis]|uniref:DUF3054 domain-containing protein n=1 Tax=Cephalotus follicularis TaxID=3775 RepID=A0A1Q3BHR9_CEPFO|nr:DUF3054 domain-containing protein [Cephalotus follicularis]
MLLLSQAPISGRECTLKLRNPNPPIFNHRKPVFISRRIAPKPRTLTLAKADGDIHSSTKNALSSSTVSQSSTFNTSEETVFVGQETVPLEGVIQFDKPHVSSRLSKWGRVALLAGGDVLALLLFSAFGRSNHGFSVFDFETLRTADPFIAGWFLSAYFFGCYAEDGRGMNGRFKALMAAAKSWAFGISLGLIIRAATSGHSPPFDFILVTMGSTAVLLIGWRALLVSVLPSDNSKKNDVYRHGSPFELFELLKSLVRRW